MFKTQDIIGDVIFMAFNDKKMLNHVGLNIECGHFKIMGYDNFGLWVEHPGLFVVNSKDENDNQLPAGEDQKKHIEGNIFIHWSNIKTLMHYPNREGFDYPSEFDKDIGFKVNE
tara:strand:- start:16 stop:357 length:342 start_codon:yes stop_codon:yes gene_type:complete